MKKEIIILGDIEMGGGTLTDDFISDATLSTLIHNLSKRNHPIDLLLNGDTFDFLKCPYIEKGIRTYPRHITPEISLSKLGLMHKAHEKVFKALLVFAQKKQHCIYFIIGNHDHDLFHKQVQERIKELLKGKNNIFFRLSYKEAQVYVEHGHQFDFLNKIDPKRLFIDYKGKPILNITWVSLGVISKFMDLKETYPFLERIRPRPELFNHCRATVKRISWRSAEYFLKSVFYYPIRYFGDPTYTFPTGLFKEFYRRLKNVHWDVDDIIPTFKRKRKRVGNFKLYVLGHVHESYVEKKGDWTMIHPDTWRDEYTLDGKTKKLIPKEKKYVDVKVDENDNISWEIIEVPIKRKILNMDDVKKDELKYIQLAAQEEGYKLPDHCEIYQ